MSTTLLTENAVKYPHVSSNYSLRDERLRRAQNDAGDVILTEVGKHAVGLNKHVFAKAGNTIGDLEGGVRDRVGNRPHECSYSLHQNPILGTGPLVVPDSPDGGDPFGDALANTMSGATAYQSVHYNQFANRPNPNEVERVRWSFYVGRYLGASTTNNLGIVVVTYPFFSETDTDGEVCHSEVVGIGFGYQKSVEVTLPANGKRAVVFSLQHTLPTQGAGTEHGLLTSNWKMEWL